MYLTKLFEKKCESTGKKLQRKNQNTVRENEEVNTEDSIQNLQVRNQYLHPHRN